MNRIIEHTDGFDCVVDGERFGTWRSRREALAGLQTEMIRARARKFTAMRAPVRRDPIIPALAPASDAQQGE